jgi:hypothetical protein
MAAEGRASVAVCPSHGSHLAKDLSLEIEAVPHARDTLLGIRYIIRPKADAEDPAVEFIFGEKAEHWSSKVIDGAKLWLRIALLPANVRKLDNGHS